MIKSFLRAMSVAMLIVGTVIGAGFATGREVVAFFGAVPNVFIALITGVAVFGCSALFLFVGRRVKRGEIGEVNGIVFGRARAIADTFMLFNSVTVLGAMLAASDTIAAEFIDIRPLASILSGLVCAYLVMRGMKGIIKANAVLVPAMIVFLTVCSLCAIDFPMRIGSSIRLHYVLLYVAMNMILGGSMLSTVSNLSPREIILASAVAALCISGLLVCIMGALNSCYAANADMPMLLIALKSGKAMYFICLPIIGASIFTTMLSAFKSVYDYIFGFVGIKWLSALIVLVGGLAVGAFGFSSVVDMLYPVTGGLGAVYILFNVWYLIRTRVKTKVKRKIRTARSRLRCQKQNHSA